MNPADIPGLPAGVPEFLRESGIESLYPPQAEAVDAGITEGESLVASVPTASGKTLIAELAMLSSVERGGTALYVVPLRALASEKKAEFERWADFDVDVGISTGNYESSEEWLASRDIVVATSEKVDSLVRNGAPWIDDLTCVVADEVHLVDDPSRGPTLEVTLAKLRRINPDLQVIALSATVDNADEVADWLDAALVKSDWRPVDLRTGVHYGDAITFDDGSQREVPVRKGERPTAALVDDTVSEDGSSLVFVNSRRNAEAAARRLADVTADHLTNEERGRLAELADDVAAVSDTETSDDLAAAVEKGAAFHHAGLCVSGETRILRPDGTFEDICSLVECSDDPGEAIGMREMRMEGVDITNTFKMGKRPTLTVETRTGNTLKLSHTHPLPVLRENGVEWIPAGELSGGEYIARPRHLRLGPDTPPSLRDLVPGDYRIYREYETVGRLSDPLGERELPSGYRSSYARDRNITVEAFRALAEKNDISASTLFNRVIADGGQIPVRIPERVNEDFCWLAGAVAGDGYLNNHEVVLTGKSALLSEFDRIVRECFDRPTSMGESPSGTPYCKLNSVVISDILREHFGIPRKGAELRLPEVGLPDDQFGAYVSGLFDADGSVSPRDNADGSPCVEFYSTSKDLITELKTALLRYGIVAFRDSRDTEGRTTEHAGRKIRSKNDVCRLTIYGVDQLRRFKENIGFRHAGKSEKLRRAIDKNPECRRGQNDVVPTSIGERVRSLRNERGVSLTDLEPEVPKATLSRFERGITPMKRSTFQSLASQLEDSVLDAVAASEVFWDRIMFVESTDSETLYDLSTASSNFVANGIVAHNTSDHRSLVEDAFRDRLLKVICATPTLAAGVNTPSRRVIVRDWRRYDGEFGGMKPLDTLEVHQMFGRAGRPGLDPYGEAVLLANDHGTMDELFERYVDADPEPVGSKLAREPAMRTHLLATISSGFARTREGLLEFLDRTLYAAQTDDTARLESVVDSTLEYLAANDFVERAGDEITATGLGHTVSRLYLDPMSAAEIVDGLREAADPTPLGLYHLVSRTPDMYQLYLKSGDRETYTELCYERESEFLGRVPSEFEDVRFEEWLSALKTAKLLEDWASEMDEDRLTDRYGVGPGDIRGKVDTAEWLLGAAERLATDLDLDCAVAVREAKKRVQYGVREELLDLAGVRSVGRKRARRLYEAGVESRADLREADKAVILGALRGRERTAERILENAGRRDPSMDGVSAEEEADGDVSDADTAGDGRGGSGGDAGADTDDAGQASLGDFE